MPRFTVPDEFAEVQIAVGGRAYAFAEGELEVELEADAKRVRVFALENAHLGITEDEPVEDEPAPETNDDDDATDDPQEEPAAEDATDEGDGEAAADEAATDEAPEEPAPATEDKPLERMNRAELVEVAEARGVATEGLTKAQIRDALAG